MRPSADLPLPCRPGQRVCEKRADPRTALHDDERGEPDREDGLQWRGHAACSEGARTGVRVPARGVAAWPSHAEREGERGRAWRTTIANSPTRNQCTCARTRVAAVEARELTTAWTVRDRLRTAASAWGEALWPQLWNHATLPRREVHGGMRGLCGLRCERAAGRDLVTPAAVPCCSHPTLADTPPCAGLGAPLELCLRVLARARAPRTQKMPIHSCSCRMLWTPARARARPAAVPHLMDVCGPQLASCCARTSSRRRQTRPHDRGLPRAAAQAAGLAQRRSQSRNLGRPQECFDKKIYSAFASRLLRDF